MTDIPQRDPGVSGERGTWTLGLPELRGRSARAGRCWHLSWRDRLAWRLFALVANDAVVHVTWRDYCWHRDAQKVEWTSVSSGKGSVAPKHSDGPSPEGET